jgi:hypothetical protein
VSEDGLVLADYCDIVRYIAHVVIVWDVKKNRSVPWFELGCVTNLSGP